MLLETLHLRNYRSFADCRLDLSGVQAAVIHGPTGAGKSSLIDGLLWALYGVQRGTDYQRIGTDTTAVEVTWRHGGTLYRVVRTRSTRTKSGKSDLSFSARAGDSWQPIGGKTIADTEAAIVRTIGMDYHTLTSGPISLQGLSDKFTRPPDVRIDGRVYTGRQARIQILAQLLGLGRYEALHKQAAGLARDLDARAGALEAQTAAATLRLAARPGLQREAQTAEAALAAARAQLAELGVSLDALTAEIATLDAEIPAAERALAVDADTRAAISSREAARATKVGRAEHYRALLARRAALEAAVARATTLDADLAAGREQLAGLAAEGRALAERVRTAEARATEAAQAAAGASDKVEHTRRAVGGRAQIEDRVSTLAATRMTRARQAEGIALEDEVLADQRAALSALMGANLEAQRQAGEIEAEARRRAAELTGVQHHLQTCRERAGLIAEVPCTAQPDLVATCPLLANARRAAEEVAGLAGTVRELAAWQRPPAPAPQDTAPLREDIRLLEATLAEDRRGLAALDRQITTLGTAEAELAALDAIAASLPTLEAEAQAAGETARAAAAAREALRGELETAKRAYLTRQAAVWALEAERATIETTGAEELPLAERELPALDAELSQLAGELETCRARLAGEAERRAALEAARVQRERSALRKSALVATLLDRQGVERRLLEELATCRASLATLDALEAETAAGRAEAERTRTRHATLGTLAEAYRAIPLMILEQQAIPALEEEANRLLARISPSGMRIRLETQREVKSRDTLADSLDIVVTDQVGRRSYEDYSGGQNFQIDLALRVALAKLQARRAGQAVETLAIDEGFGSQSAECLDGIVEALRAIRADFPRLLVVSHVEAMRDTFGQRIAVSGGPAESRAEVVG